MKRTFFLFQIPGRKGPLGPGFVSWVLFLFFIAGVALLGLSGHDPTLASPLPQASDSLSVYFFNVDQGDATLLVGPDFTILIDAGRHDRDDVVSYIRSTGVEHIDLFIGTHPHSDHIGQCASVMNHFRVEEVWLSGDVHTTRTFERCLDAILASDAGYHEPRAGEVTEIGSARIEVVHPASVTGDLNNGSVSVRIIYGNTVFLFTGDAEQEAEQAMLQRGHPLKAHILHLGHHGSRTSTTMAFLQAVQPEIAIYSAGKDNSYGHPHKEVIDRLAMLHVPVYGTDVHDTIVVTTDGHRYDVILGQTGNSLTAAGPGEDGWEGCEPGQININAASLEDLIRIVHVGPVVAERIVAGRPYLSVDSLITVGGIGDKRLEDIKNQRLACAGAPSF